ncbi:hypothetical protein [Sulfurovum sp. NBC37-1]|uniref:hypothetical protein n=1 Tax=Sulfurovum sp. (strain NBC37-1) TaxID=387093 RepID=UPI000158750F|nr:hypothetical protein [Sulfurovum sp. NBC37-1]BAF71478.1 hypothetical protein SUN_0518 [Sulfurovum sp. NBC37-1]
MGMLSHLYPKKRGNKEYATDVMTPAAKKLLLLLFVLFLLLFPHYAPWETAHTQNYSIVGQIFSLYFFIANQTLGIIHESGHGVCYILPCPEFLMVLNGTLFQLLFPAGIAYYYKRKRKRFAMHIALFFVGFSLYYTAWYISTAHEGLILPASKSFLGIDAYHDFNYLLGKMGILQHESLIAGITRFMAYAIMVVSVIGMFFDTFRTGEKSKLK